MMKHLLINATLLLASSALLVTGCSVQKTEDVRIKLCKEVTEHLLDTMKPITWKSTAVNFRKVGDASIKLGFGINKPGYEDQTVSSTCFFEYEAVEETAIDHVDPLSAYATLPYHMSVQGKNVPKKLLNQAVTAEQIEPFIEFADQVKVEIEKLKQRVQ